MLTVRYEQLGLLSGDRMLDMGAGGGRHAFEAVRRGAHVVAFDLGMSDLRQAAATLYAMRDSSRWLASDMVQMRLTICDDA